MWSGSLWVNGWVRAVWLALSAWIFIKLSAQLLAKSFCKSKGSLGIRGVPVTINWAEGRRREVSGNAQPSQWGGRSPVGSCLGPCTQTYLRDLPKRLGEETRRLAGSTEWSEGWKGGTTGRGILHDSGLAKWNVMQGEQCSAQAELWAPSSPSASRVNFWVLHKSFRPTAVKNCWGAAWF